MWRHFQILSQFTWLKALKPFWIKFKKNCAKQGSKFDVHSSNQKEHCLIQQLTQTMTPSRSHSRYLYSTSHDYRLFFYFFFKEFRPKDSRIPIHTVGARLHLHQVSCVLQRWSRSAYLSVTLPSPGVRVQVCWEATQGSVFIVRRDLRCDCSFARRNDRGLWRYAKKLRVYLVYICLKLYLSWCVQNILPV